jgi:hypothetical protein
MPKMNATRYLKGECQKCGGHIEFPAETIGQEIQCPHCGEQTELTLLTPPQEPLVPRRVLIWTAVAVLILAFGLVGTLVALNRAHHLMASQRPLTQNPPPASIPEQPSMRDDFVVSPIRLERTEGSSLIYAVGTVKNGAERKRLGVRIELEVLDSGGSKVGSTRDYVQLIEPGNEWHFRALINSTNAAAARLGAITEEK